MLDATRNPRRVQVLENRRLTPQMIRIVFGGEELEGFGAGEFTDHYVKLRISPGEPSRAPAPTPCATGTASG